MLTLCAVQMLVLLLLLLIELPPPLLEITQKRAVSRLCLQLIHVIQIMDGGRIFYVGEQSGSKAEGLGQRKIDTVEH